MSENHLGDLLKWSTSPDDEKVRRTISRKTLEKKGKNSFIQVKKVEEKRIFTKLTGFVKRLGLMLNLRPTQVSVYAVNGV